MELSKSLLQREVVYKTARSGGKGGQNVNKVSTKVELLFDLQNSGLFTEEQKELLFQKLNARLNKDGAIQVICDAERSQYLNKEKALDRLQQLLSAALVKPKPRKASKVPKSVIAARRENKRRQAEKKEGRKKFF